VLYSGALNEDVLRSEGISSFSMLSLKNRRIAKIFLPVMLFGYTGVFLHRYKLDVVMNANNHKWMFPVALAARLRGKKSVARIAGDIMLGRTKGVKGKLALIHNKVVEKVSLFAVDKIVCLSDSLKEITIKRTGFDKKVRVISQGVDSDRFIMTDRDKISENSQVRLIFIGRIEINKGLHYALQAFCRLKERGINLYFDIYGDGSQRAFLENRCQNIKGIHFHGYIYHDDIPSALAEGGILVLPSIYEGFGHVVLEAMASGVPVIATAVGDLPKFMENGNNGILVPVRDIEAISDAILRYINDPEFRTGCIGNAKRYVNNEHSYRVLREKHLALFS